MPDMDGFDVAEQIKNELGHASPTIMMLTSADRRGDVSRSRDLGVASYLMKPIKPSDLLDALLTSLGQAKQTRTALPVILHHAIGDLGPGLRILLAEDNAINQKVAVRMLEKRGHTVVVTDNGEAAVEALVQQPEDAPFDIVLMDVHMPIMDGYEATAAIRKREVEGGSHIPIIALTANAMKGDAEKCLEAGMDGYLSKPLHLPDLLGAIQRVVRREPNVQAVAAAESSGELPAFDIATALVSVEEDRDLLRDLAVVFCEDVPHSISEIENSIAQNDAETLERLAHSLKSSTGSLGGKAAAAAALVLEGIGRSRNLLDADRAFHTLRYEMDRLTQALSALSST
jgi:CheY-like chemotaxis protein